VEYNTDVIDVSEVMHRGTEVVLTTDASYHQTSCGYTNLRGLHQILKSADV